MRKYLTRDIFDCMMNDYNNGLNLPDMADKYGFQEQTIQRHFNKYGIRFTKGNTKPFGEDELNGIIEDYKKGIRPHELQEKYGRDSTSIITKLKSLGLYQYSTHHYTDEEIEFLKIYYPIGDWESIKQFLPNVFMNSIYHKMSELGISQDSAFWTPDDERILIDNYNESLYGNIESIVELFNGKYSYKAIISKARKLGLKTRSVWSDEENQIIKDNYSTMMIDDLMNLLPNRSRAMIIAKGSEFGLVNKLKLDSQFTNEEHEFILNNYLSMTDKEIGEILNKNTHRISDYRFRHQWIKHTEETCYTALSDFIRKNNQEWRKQSIEKCNNQCVITGDVFDEVHHIHGFNLIFAEVIDVLNIDIKQSFGDYSKDELFEILYTFRALQNTYPLGVCLRKDIHKLFHKMYGYGYNTVEQWNEFKEKYYKLS